MTHRRQQQSKRNSKRGKVRDMNSTRAQGVCKSGKRRFADEATAALALARAQHNALRSDQRRECRYYYDRNCRGWHLSSWSIEDARKQGLL